MIGINVSLNQPEKIPHKEELIRESCIFLAWMSESERKFPLMGYSPNRPLYLYFAQNLHESMHTF